MKTSLSLESKNEDTSYLGNLLNARYSARAFQDKPVSRDLLEAILHQAAKAPSSGNLQPWNVYVLTGTAKQKLEDGIAAKIAAGEKESPDVSAYPSPIFSPYKERRFECGMALYNALGIEREDFEARDRQFRENFKFFGAPVGMILTMHKDVTTGQFIDLGIYLQTLMLAAQEKGLSTCAQLCWTFWPDSVRASLDIESDQQIVLGVALGYEDSSQPVNQYRTSRVDLKEYVSFLGCYSSTDK